MSLTGKWNFFGFATKAKARLVARRDMQRELWILQICIRLLVATSSVRLLAAFANEYDLELCHFDVDQAFVRADLKEDVFMRLPEGCGALSGKIVRAKRVSNCYMQEKKKLTLCVWMSVCSVNLGFSVEKIVLVLV